MKAKKNCYRQGDVLLERVASIPATAVKQERNGPIILAYGEVTGHHHALEADPADWWKDGEEQFVEVTEPSRLTHQEHATVTLPAGKYRVTRQREYSPEAIRNVAD